MEMERIPRKRRRNACYSTDEKKCGEKCAAVTEMMRLERKKAIFDKQEKALRKMQRVVTDQMVKVEVEGLQLAANVREKEEEEFSLPFDEANIHENLSKAPSSCEPVNLDDDIKEINTYKLDLDTCLDEMLYNAYCPPAAEEEDDEDELDFHYLQEFKSELN